MLLAFSACSPASVSPYFRAESGPVETLVQSVDIGPVYPEELEHATEALLDAPPVVVFHIDSPGGDVFTGLEFVEMMRSAQRRGTHIRCLVDGMAASMAAYILQACDVRLMTRQSTVMFHTVSVSGARGNQWELERLVQMMEELNRRLAIFIAGRLNISLKEYEAQVLDRDWWLGWEEALEVGAVDGVL